ncbi:probable palmitoyltransferase ZDHHC24 [Drosophila bipectinata]|uniref:probable palmitoyltransferase ZDHHC24 n=1 Tax=Drosophila bipectinata TaxID=42026 RepID=UPI0038B40368
MKVKCRRPRRPVRRMVHRVCMTIRSCTKRHKRTFMAILHSTSALVLVGVILFLIFYDMWYVLPTIFDPEGLVYGLHWLLVVFLVCNVLGNMWAAFHCDTSVASLAIGRQKPAEGEAHLWHYCSTCQLQVPPRSWHCKACNCCILKRDHHCTFVANCVGHKNQRHFLGFVFHLFLGSGLALIYNGIYTWKYGSFLVADPLLMVASLANNITDYDAMSWKFVVATIFKLNLFAFVVALVMFSFQMILACRNSTCYKIFDRTYNLGWRQNLKVVLGNRLFWIFLWPTIKSPLPHDGSQWYIEPSGKKINII